MGSFARFSKRNLGLSVGGWAVFTALWLVFSPAPPESGFATRLILPGLLLGSAALIVVLSPVYYDGFEIERSRVSLYSARNSESSSSWHFQLPDLDRIALREWEGTGSLRTPGAHTVALSLQLANGTWVAAPVRRPFDASASWAPTIQMRPAGSWRWRPLRGGDGRPLRWYAGTDAQVAAHFTAQIEGVREVLRDLDPAALTPRPRAIDDGGPTSLLRCDTRWRSPQTRRPTAISTALDGSDPPVPPARAPQQPPPRPTLPEPQAAAQGLRRTRAMPGPAWHDLAEPARYWTLASQRAGSIAGRRSAMVIARDGIRFDRRWRRDLHVPLADADRFDIVFDGIPSREIDSDEPLEGNWRLMLVQRSGAAIPLSGLDHGYFKGNQLYWASGAAAAAGGTDERPTGSMPWPDEQPLLVAARLNAHLAAMRKAS